MLEDDEWDVLMAAQNLIDSPERAMEVLAREAERRGLRPPLHSGEEATPAQRRLWHILAGYEMFTGYQETNPNAVRHHLVSKYGPPCPQCGKALRTPTARICPVCDWAEDPG